MTLRLVQLQTRQGGRFVAALDSGERATRLDVYALALRALAEGISLADAVAQHLTRDVIPLGAAADDMRFLAPIDHPDPAHLHLTGTGLTHLGSAESRDKMHALAAAGGAQTDSMRMFLQGLQGGKPPDLREILLY